MPIHPTAEIHPSAIIHETASIGPRVIVGEGCEIGEGCELLAGAIICPNVRMGRGNKIHYYAIIGNDPQHVTFDTRIKTGVRMGDHNVIREHASIHRSIMPGTDTVLGNNNYLMATGHIAHDCIIHNHVIISNMGGIAGHVEIGDRAFISGPVGVHQWVRIGRLAMVGGMSGVNRDVPPFMLVQNISELAGLNVVGLRRAGVPGSTRQMLKHIYKELFRSGRLLAPALKDIEESLAGREVPPEVREFLDFCSARSKRGISRGPRARGAADQPEVNAD